MVSDMVPVPYKLRKLNFCATNHPTIKNKVSLTLLIKESALGFPPGQKVSLLLINLTPFSLFSIISNKICAIILFLNEILKK